MKVMHVMAGAEQGGAETFFLDAVRALDRHGIEQVVVTRPQHARRLSQTKAALYTAPFNKVFRGSTRRAIAAACAAHRPEIIQYWMGRAASYAQPLGAVNIGWFGGYYDLKRYRHCDWYVGVTQDIVDHIRAHVARPERARLIHTIAELDEAEAVARAGLDTPPDAPLLLALARLHWKKGLDVLLAALAQVPRAHLWIAGDGPLRKDLERQAQALGVAGRVRFLGWRLDRAALLKAADICVFPSRYEPFGTVMVEAWAMGTPLVAAAAAGPKAYVKDGENGLLVPVDDVQSLAAAVNRLLAEPDLRQRVVAGGLQTYRSTFTEQSFIATVIAFYREVLDCAAAGRTPLTAG